MTTTTETRPTESAYVAGDLSEFLKLVTVNYLDTLDRSDLELTFPKLSTLFPGRFGLSYHNSYSRGLSIVPGRQVVNVHCFDSSLRDVGEGLVTRYKLRLPTSIDAELIIASSVRDVGL